MVPLAPLRVTVVLLSRVRLTAGNHLPGALQWDPLILKSGGGFRKPSVKT